MERGLFGELGAELARRGWLASNEHARHLAASCTDLMRA